MELLFQAGLDKSPVFVKDWGSGISGIWSPDGKRILVTARECSADQWCEIFQVHGDSLRQITKIDSQIPLFLKGMHHYHVTGLNWSNDSTSVYVKASAWGNAGVKSGLFLVDADRGEMTRTLSDAELPK
jgi:hypothetical protein